MPTLVSQSQCLSEAMATTGQRRPRSAIDDNAPKDVNIPNDPSPLSRDTAAGVNRQRGDPFPLLSGTPEERIDEMKAHMVSMNETIMSLITRIENKADRTFAHQAQVMRAKIDKLPTRSDLDKIYARVDGMDVKVHRRDQVAP